MKFLAAFVLVSTIGGAAAQGGRQGLSDARGASMARPGSATQERAGTRQLSPEQRAELRRQIMQASRRPGRP